MRQGLLGLVGALTLTATAAGSACSYDQDDPGSGGGRAAGGSTGQGGSTGTGGSTSVDGSAGSAGSGGSLNCTNVAPCGGGVVGTWNVTSSCLKFSGNMDVSLASLGCPTVPVNGSLQTTGTFVANANGTYGDNTTTTGSVTFPLAASCLTVSSVAVGCDKIGNIFTALGWTPPSARIQMASVAAHSASSSVVGLARRPFTEPTGSYTTAGNTLTAANVNVLVLRFGRHADRHPADVGLTGTVVLRGKVLAARAAWAVPVAAVPAAAVPAAPAAVAPAVPAVPAAAEARVVLEVVQEAPGRATSMQPPTTRAWRLTARFVPSSLRTVAISIRSGARTA